MAIQGHYIHIHIYTYICAPEAVSSRGLPLCEQKVPSGGTQPHRHIATQSSLVPRQIQAKKFFLL